MKAKIFYGPERTGKTLVASILPTLFGSDKVIYLTGVNAKATNIRNEIEKTISKQTVAIIIDDVPDNFNYEVFYSILPHGNFISNKKYQPKEDLHLVNVLLIFTTNHLPIQTNDASFKRRFEIIEFPTDQFSHTKL